MKNTRKQHKGFSLIELVIVVAIIGILALMIIPQFNNVTKDAKEKAFTGNCQTIVSAITMYQAGHNGDYPADDAALNPYLNTTIAELNAKGGQPTGAHYEYTCVNGEGKLVCTYTGVADFVYPANTEEGGNNNEGGNNQGGNNEG